MTTHVLRGGLIGCGFFAPHHLNGWREVGGAEIAAVCDVDAARAQAASAAFGIEAVYTDAAEMLAGERLDFVDIVTPPETHRRLVERAAGHGVPVICQKPMALDPDDAQAMVTACRSAGVPFMVHENFRFQPPMQALKAAADAVGPLFFGRISFRSAYDIYAAQPYLAEADRFIVLDLGVHLLDLARYFFGDMEQLWCRTQRVNPDIRAEDVATLLLKSNASATCVVDMSYASVLEDETFPQTLAHLEGANGSAVLGPHYRLTVTTPDGVQHPDASGPDFDWLTPPFEVIQQSIVATQRHWIDCLRTGHTPDTSGEDNLRTLALVFGAYASADSGLPFRPGPPP